MLKVKWAFPKMGVAPQIPPCGGAAGFWRSMLLAEKDPGFEITAEEAEEQATHQPVKVFHPFNPNPPLPPWL